MSQLSIRAAAVVVSVALASVLGGCASTGGVGPIGPEPGAPTPTLGSLTAVPDPKDDDKPVKRDAHRSEARASDRGWSSRFRR